MINTVNILNISGDIFQEMNSTLENSGYSKSVINPNNINTKRTFGLMGDRPSGVRIIKLLKDAESGSNPTASGGYLGDKNSQYSIIYFSNMNLMAASTSKVDRIGTIKKIARREQSSPYGNKPARGLVKGGGHKYSKKIKRSKVTKKNKYVNRRRKTRAKRNKTRKDKYN